MAPVVTSQATQRLTIVGGDLRSGDLAGALLNEDAATPSPDGMGELSPKFEPILDLYGQLEDQTAQPEEIEVGTVLHLFLLGVDARFVGRGIRAGCGCLILTVPSRAGGQGSFHEAMPLPVGGAPPRVRDLRLLNRVRPCGEMGTGAGDGHGWQPA